MFVPEQQHLSNKSSSQTPTWFIRRCHPRRPDGIGTTGEVPERKGSPMEDSPQSYIHAILYHNIIRYNILVYIVLCTIM